MFLNNTFQLEKPTDSYFDGLVIAVWIYGKMVGTQKNEGLCGIFLPSVCL